MSDKEIDRLRKIEMEIVQMLSHEVKGGDDKTAVQLAYSLLSDRNRLFYLNEDKFRTIQAYCKAADEDKAKIKALERELGQAQRCIEDINEIGRQVRNG